MRHKNWLRAATLLGLILVLGSCEPSDPGSPAANQSPTTRIVVAPLQNSVHDHYVSPSSMFWVQWYGHDVDGQVNGFYLKVDDGPEVFTTKGDSAITFNSPDPGHPTQHTLTVSAIDNEGLRDQNPPTRTFSATNRAPEIDAFNASFPDSAQVGSGISFDVEWSDPNTSGAFLRVLIDGEPVCGWSERTHFQFCNTGDASILTQLDTFTVTTISSSTLTPGEHDLSVEVIDWGGARGEPYTRHITVLAGQYPDLTSIKSKYGSTDYYPDGSTFYTVNVTTSFEMVGTASGYFGTVHSYQYRYHFRSLPESPADTVWGDWTTWSAWIAAEFDVFNLAPGEYQFEAVCRDWTGAQSEVNSFDISILIPNFSAKTLLVVDETRDGNGRPGSPNDEQCDDFYRYILDYDTASMVTSTGWQVTELDFATTRPPNNARFVSARDVFNQRVIVWHGDDKSEVLLGENTTILGEYLERGGRLILSGQDILGAFSTNDVAEFVSGFPYKYLRVGGGSRSTERNTDGGFIAMIGDPGLGWVDTLAIDPDKISSRWNGIDGCWALAPRHRTIEIGYWHGFIPATEWESGCVCVANFDDVNVWRTITLGFPLYFMDNDQSRTFMTTALSALDE